MASYKISGLATRGYAEVARILFKLADVEFEDDRIPRDQLASRKPEFPLGEVPVLWIDGEAFCQSHTIARYVAKKFGYMGSDLKEELFVDELLEVIMEVMRNHLGPIVVEQDEQKKKEKAENFLKDGFVRYLDFIERRLKSNNNGQGFYAGKSITVADVSFHCLFYTLRKWLGTIGITVTTLEDRPLLEAWYNRVESYPKIAEWVKIRPDTVF